MIDEHLYPEAEWDYKPINDHIIAKLDKVEEVTTPSGIILQVENATETEGGSNAMKVLTATVLAAGFSKVHSLTGNRSEMVVRVGDKVRLRDMRYPLIEFRGDSECISIVETDIIGVYLKKDSKDDRLVNYWSRKTEPIIPMRDMNGNPFQDTKPRGTSGTVGNSPITYTAAYDTRTLLERSVPSVGNHKVELNPPLYGGMGSHTTKEAK